MTETIARATRTPATKTIAIVEDDRPIADLIARALSDQGYETACYQTGKAFLDTLKDGEPSLCLIDLGLPDVDGIGLLGLIREVSAVPVIIVSARRYPSDRIVGLELGADDYVVKPFDAREIVARVRTVLRRVEAGAHDLSHATPRARFAGWTFDIGSMELTAPDGTPVDISSAEARLLQTLLEAPQRVLSREFLLTRVGKEENIGRVIDNRVSRLRQKLQHGDSKKSLIHTVYGAGYLLACPVEWTAA
ncbi:MAG: response regulator transcription factor [Fimbriimonadaceae bacterium]|nr:response regulator transcription factor [Alphaproteobacteria bacterium]